MTPRSTSEQPVSAGAEQLSTLLDSVRALHAILSADGVIQYASLGFTRVLGYRPGELVGPPITLLLHPKELKAARQRLTEPAASPGLLPSERCRLRVKEGGW